MSVSPRPAPAGCLQGEQLPEGVAASQPCPGDLGAPFSLTYEQLTFLIPSFPVEESGTQVLFAFHCPVKLPVIFWHLGFLGMSTSL